LALAPALAQALLSQAGQAKPEKCQFDSGNISLLPIKIQLFAGYMPLSHAS
jgi:hypothetical protein